MKLRTIKNTEETEVSHNPQIKKRLLVANGEIEHVTNFSRAVFPPGEIAHAHSHSDMTEVFFVESGEGMITVDETCIPLEIGTCITVEPNEIHELSNTGASDLVVVYFGIKS